MSIESSGIVMPQRESFAYTPDQQSFFKSRLFICLALLIIIPLVTYWPVFSHDFQMKWDDWWVVMNEYTEDGFYGENLRAIITDFYHGQYAPVNQFYYLTIYAIFGYNPFWFHAAGLLVHIANVLLVFFLIRRLLQKSGDGFTTDSVLHISFITALIMSLHPFLVEAVSWVSASKCIIYTFFYLLALHAWISYIDSQKLLYFVLMLLCYALSFGGKEQAVTLPVCLLLLDHTMKRNMRNWQVWVEKVPVFFITAGFVILTFYSQKFNGEGILSKQELHPWYQNLAFASYSVVEYFIKCVLPLRLTYIYPFPNLPGQPMPVHFWLYPALLLFVVAGFWKLLKQRWLFWGIGFFLVQASVMCNIVPTARFAIIADRYVYLASVGIFFLIAYYTDRFLKSENKYRKLILSGGLLYVLCLGVYANQRTRVWHDSTTLKYEMQKVLKSRSDYAEWRKKYDQQMQDNPE